MVIPETYMSHHFSCLAVLPTQSETSNLLSFPAKYISAIAIISGSHCRHNVVHMLSLTKVQAICTILGNFFLSPFRPLAYLRRYEYGCSTMKSNLIVCSNILSKVMTSSLGSLPNSAQVTSSMLAFAIFMMSRHFFGVSSTFPARKRQQHAVTCLGNSWNVCTM